MTSPTQRALALCKANGWPYGIVEKWVPNTPPDEKQPGEKPKGNPFGMRRDLWSIGDLIVLDDEPGALLVQVCAGASHAARAAKVRKTIMGGTLGTESELTIGRILRDSNALKKWCAKGCRIEIWSFAKKGARGSRKLWELRRERITATEEPTS